jgi:hypothetical protein
MKARAVPSPLAPSYLVKLKLKPYVPSFPDGNRQPRILLRMHDSASDAPAPPHERLEMSTPVTAPLAVSVIAVLTLPARLGFAFRPYSL